MQLLDTTATLPYQFLACVNKNIHGWLLRISGSFVRGVCEFRMLLSLLMTGAVGARLSNYHPSTVLLQDSNNK